MAEPCDCDALRVENAGLRTALDSRLVIGQAQGMLMALLSVDAGEAFRLLVRRSQNEHRKLRLVAGDVIEEVLQRGATETPV